MVGHVIRLVIAVAFGLVLCACDYEVTLPRPIWIEDDFSPDQRAVITAAIDEWNFHSERCIGEPALVLEGIYDDPNGFDEDNFDDGISVIYLGSSQEVYDRINRRSKEKGLAVIGYGPKGDILIFPSKNWEMEDYLSTVLHEFGHFIGLGHSPFDKLALMYPVYDESQTGHVTANDLEAFCIEYDCHGCEFVPY